MVAIGIVDDLTHLPTVLAVLLGIVEDEQFAATGLRIRVDVFVLIVEVVKRILPFVNAITPVFVKRAELVGFVEIHELHAAEHGVAHEHGEASTILHHGLLRAGRGQVRGGFGSVGAGSRVLPFVDQRGVDGTNHNAQPGDDVP